MTLQTKLQELYSPFTTRLTCKVFHYRKTGSPTKYVVWSETGEEESFGADNRKAEQQLTGIIDFYTKTEFDPIADDIQTVLNSEEVGWRLDSVQYENETNLIHYQWRWWLG